ncbi:hypothetical protein [Schlesneria paludicola]|uniref:hypothetical protein n=1 Tax=Schlesneria paludicola TaxID=360056 RepID=UPI00029A343E|nr:hypothetical protein [Schlesneria paludicola]
MSKYITVEVHFVEGTVGAAGGITLSGKFDIDFGIKIYTSPAGWEVLEHDALSLTEQEFKFNRKKARDCHHMFKLKLNDNSDPTITPHGNTRIKDVSYQNDDDGL